MIKANPLYLADHLMIAKQWLDDVFIKCLDVIQKSKKLSSHYGTLVFGRLKSRKNTVHCENAIYWTICKRTLKKPVSWGTGYIDLLRWAFSKAYFVLNQPKETSTAKLQKKKGGRKIRIHDFRTKKIKCSILVLFFIHLKFQILIQSINKPVL